MKITSSEARVLAVSFHQKKSNATFLKWHMVMLDDWYLFSMKEKDGVWLRGTIVNGKTSKVIEINSKCFYSFRNKKKQYKLISRDGKHIVEESNRNTQPKPRDKSRANIEK